MWVKICGTTNLADAQLSVAHGADALGFIFAPSKRQISAEQAATITAQLPPAIDRVGVFTTPNPEEIAATVRQVGLTAVQLHFRHDPALTARLHTLLEPHIRLIQVLAIEVGMDEPSTPDRLAQDLDAAFGDAALWAILLDAASGGQSGGLGRNFPWQSVRPVLARAMHDAERAPSHIPPRAKTRPRLLLAGGLHAGNIEEAISTLEPWGVDCVSGVEASPGQKSQSRLISFLTAAKT